MPPAEDGRDPLPIQIFAGHLEFLCDVLRYARNTPIVAFDCQIAAGKLSGDRRAARASESLTKRDANAKWRAVRRAKYSREEISPAAHSPPPPSAAGRHSPATQPTTFA